MWTYKKNIGFFLLIFLLMVTCNRQQRKNINESINEGSIANSSMIIESDTSKCFVHNNVTLYELYSNPINENDLGNWGTIVSYFIIGSNTIHIHWNANCGVTFKSTFLNDKIILYWNMEEVEGAPCEGYFNLFQSIKARKPNKNEKFAEMSLLNDTTILVTYKHKEWIHKINYGEPYSDCLFPDTLRYYKSW